MAKYICTEIKTPAIIKATTDSLKANEFKIPTFVSFFSHINNPLKRNFFTFSLNAYLFVHAIKKAATNPLNKVCKTKLI
jgi:hypothetical protein